MPDIDIDFADRDQALKLFSTVSASRQDGSRLVKHNTGVYFHDVPVDVDTNLCAKNYIEAESDRYFKIDFLNAGIYKGVRNEQHLTELMQKEPLWDLLDQKDFVDLLFHVNGHADILKRIKPRSIEQLAAILALIRPAKRYLLDRTMQEILQEVWIKPDGDEYYFKKSHAIAYATAIVVQMNLICEQISYEFS